jgi:beta-glucosidase/6-phospho-beta-glucosidase/beta-galactosidase
VSWRQFLPAQARASWRSAAHRLELMLNRQFTDPVLGGSYPAGFAQLYTGVSNLSFRRDGDLEVMAAPLDFLGVNYYYRLYAADAPYAQPEPALRSAADIGVRQVQPAGVATTELGWPVEPEGLFDTLTGLAGRYPGLPAVYITESGGAELRDGPEQDPERIAFIAEHLAAATRAAAAHDGLDLRGYFYEPVFRRYLGDAMRSERENLPDMTPTIHSGQTTERDGERCGRVQSAATGCSARALVPGLLKCAMDVAARVVRDYTH